MGSEEGAGREPQQEGARGAATRGRAATGSDAGLRQTASGTAR